MEKIFSDSIRVEVFQEGYGSGLQNEVNEFLSNANVMVIDIKFSVSVTFDSIGEIGIPMHSCMVIYRTNS